MRARVGRAMNKRKKKKSALDARSDIPLHRSNSRSSSHRHRTLLSISTAAAAAFHQHRLTQGRHAFARRGGRWRCACSRQAPASGHAAVLATVTLLLRFLSVYLSDGTTHGTLPVKLVAEAEAVAAAVTTVAGETRRSGRHDFPLSLCLRVCELHGRTGREDERTNGR